MVSDPSSTGNATYGTWNNTGAYAENYPGDNSNLDLGEAVQMDTNGDGSLDGEPWLRATDMDRYRLEFRMEDGSTIHGVGVIITGTDPGTGARYQSMVFGDLLVGRLNASGVNITGITLGEYITTGLGGMDLTQVFQMDNFANELAAFEVVPCFAGGTLIETETGATRVKDLKTGDRVRTADHGMQEIRWIGRRKVAALDRMAPVLIRKGALGNDRDMLVSQQHRMLIAGEAVHELFDETEVLAPAKSLVNGTSIVIQEDEAVEYFHLLFDRHEIVFADGCRAESLYLGEQALKGFDAEAQAEIAELFPDLAELHRIGKSFAGARRFLTVREGRQLRDKLFGLTPDEAARIAS
ncbi:Hint domain-containing protein [Paracoccus lutimaris]|uniref:Hint domain-containing protein n=1 Tax=Paracoccus lutimaris TaxID=1490030 RepID=A0A368YIU2_9RHOB|nr:Hint domain-containing protein [Paracoccus lutimaris]RCW79418.1 Hint domain-containing protein [Paracoccus lutimaris]